VLVGNKHHPQDKIFELPLPGQIYQTMTMRSRTKPNLPALTRWQPRLHSSLLVALAYGSNCALYKRVVSYRTAFSLRAVV